MSNLLDNLFIKRFCLPVNTDIDLYESGKNSITSCVCFPYNHVSCVFKGKIKSFNKSLKKNRVLSYGVNHMGDTNGIKPGIHAEYEAISKLMPIKYKKNLEEISLLVIRLSPTNKLQISKPCYNCIQIIKTIPIKKGYKIKEIYYSNSEGNIIKTSLENLDKEEYHYPRHDKPIK
jgi:hypothetical protein